MLLFPLQTLNMVSRLTGTSQGIKNMQESREPNFDVINKSNSSHLNAR